MTWKVSYRGLAEVVNENNVSMTFEDRDSIDSAYGSGIRHTLRYLGFEVIENDDHTIRSVTISDEMLAKLIEDCKEGING